MINYTMATINSPYAAIFGVLVLLTILVSMLYVVGHAESRRKSIELSKEEFVRLHRVAERYHRFSVIVKARHTRKVFVEGWLVPTAFAGKQELESDYAVISEILHRQVNIVDIAGVYYFIYTN